MSYAPLEITLQSNYVADQKLTVRPSLEEPAYTVHFVNRVLHVEQSLSVKPRDLGNYLKTFLESVYYDDDIHMPIQHVQFDVPGYPTVIVNAENLQLYIANLLDQVDVLRKNWPVEQSHATKKSVWDSRLRRRTSGGRVGSCEEW
jgi:hypothetical protein